MHEISICFIEFGLNIDIVSMPWKNRTLMVLLQLPDPARRKTNTMLKCSEGCSEEIIKEKNNRACSYNLC